MTYSGASETVGAASDDPDGGVDRISARTTLQEGTMASEVRQVALRQTVTTDRRDRARWGPILMGALVAVATYVLLEMALLAAELLDQDDAAVFDLPDGAWWSVLAAVVAFFLGGLVVGASMASRDADDGLLNGLAVWAVAGVTLFVLALVGTGLALGTLGYTVDRLGEGQAQAGASGDLEEFAGMSAIALGATAVAAALGGLIGSKLWPRARHDDTLTIHEHDMRPVVQR